MTNVQSVGFKANSTYNAVKININKPQASVPEGLKSSKDAEFNAVNIEVNNPSIETIPKSIYNYPEAEDLITYDKLGFMPLELPALPPVPIAYEASYISIEPTDEKNESEQKQVQEDSKPVIIELDDVTAVPIPNVTTPENEKLNNAGTLNFHGINFKAAQPQVLEDGNLKPSVNIEKVVENLKSADPYTQTSQLKDIAQTALKKPQEAIPYYTTAVFSALIDIVNKDNSSLEKPSKEQIEIREAIILNEFVKEQQMREGKKPEEIKLPYQISKEDIEFAEKLSPYEIAERNKEFGIYTLASLAKAYGEEFEKQTGNVVPITELPGIGDIVNVLSTSKDPDIKLAVMDSLMIIRRPEYKNEIKAIFEVMTQDKEPLLAQYAAMAMKELDK